MPTTDACNREVPSWLQNVFAGRDTIQSWIVRLKILDAELTEWDRHVFGADIETENIRKLLHSAITLARNGMPYQQCWCDPRELDCPLCKGKRWTSAGQALKVLNQQQQQQSLG